MFAEGIKGVTDHKKKERWNVFKNPPIKKKTGSMQESKFIDFITKACKLMSYLVTFAVILGAAVISKGTLLFMTSQIAPNRTVSYCNKGLDVHKEYIVTLPTVERLVWIWIIIFSYFTAELMTFLRSLRVCLFKKWSMPATVEVIFLFVTESLPAVGSALLVFCILPELDVLKGVMLTNAVCFVPAVSGFIFRNKNSEEEYLGGPSENNKLKYFMKTYIPKALDIFSIVAQATAFVIWPLMDNKNSLWIIPLSIILISFGWLENYIPQNILNKWIRKLSKKKREHDIDDMEVETDDDSDDEDYEDQDCNWQFNNSRYFVYLFLSVWKCLLFFVTALTVIWLKEGSVQFLFNDFITAFEDHDIIITEIKPIISSKIKYNIEEVIYLGGSEAVPANNLTPIWVLIVNISTTYICYAFGKFACKITIQTFGYAFPINLAVPVTITTLIIFCGLHNVDSCYFHNTIPPYLFFNSPPVYFVWDFIGTQQSWIWFFWLLSQTWITIHIWSPNCGKLTPTEKLYIKPMYDAFVIDQSLAMNRRKNFISKTALNSNHGTTYDGDETTKIYACATMWHETKEEMTSFLKSIIRLDEDQFARRLVREELEIYLKDEYYELETHIFFDDAFIRVSKDDNDPKLNTFVEQLIEAVHEAIVEVHPFQIKKQYAKKYVTPYGGRLEWILPGQTNLIVHLKDRKKIRAKKRWSQVMYMYYLLGFKLMDTDYTPQQKDKMSNNTFLLALDGDIDFQPAAVHHLVTLMKRNLNLGAACGRIHPLGSGPMVWYQIFEYSIAHWLQKATEHVIGCVLCSPGCFSLFRAKALMDDNVMAKYTLRSHEARHFVQYDQGEDRWLCTLLLQRGYRVEYCSASDSYTHCPEKFIEFYNQRRRWMPSTTANILDLLVDYKHLLKINNNISGLYIFYQGVLMVGTILGPGSIFLMLVGSFVSAFQISQWSSFLWNAFPIIFYMAICFCCKSDVQLFFAGLLSAIYGLVMMAVLVGVMLQINIDGPLAPSSLFFFGIAAQMIITAMFHPKEVGNLLYGIVYYVTIPSMYLVLVIYSIFNLNDISWGTRDVTVIPAKSKEEKDNTSKNDASDTNKEKNKVINLFGSEAKEKKTGSFEFSLAGLFTCMLCTHSKQPEENEKLKEISDSISKVSNRLIEIENYIYNKPNDLPTNAATSIETTKDKNVENSTKLTGILREQSGIFVADSPNSWLKGDCVDSGIHVCIPRSERKFWEAIVGGMLKPYDDDQAKVAKELKDLRDKMVMAFIMLNSIFVLVVFLLTLKKDFLHVRWPLNVKVNFTYIDSTREIKIYKQYLELEPIGFIFLIFFASLLFVQFMAMLVHRFSTFSQILASTYINWSYFTQLNKHTITPDQILENDPVKVVKMLLKPSKSKEASAGRRKTVKYRAAAYDNDTQDEVYDLKDAFSKNKSKTNVGSMRKSMMIAYEKKRDTVKYTTQQIGPPQQFNMTFTNNAFEPDL